MPEPDSKPDELAAPIQPTGFGVADLEIAREQDALADGEPIAPDAELDRDRGGTLSE